MIFYLIHCQARSLAHLYLARCITGVSVAVAPSIISPYPHVQVGIGAGVPIASIYLREISTPELRGTLTILYDDRNRVCRMLRARCQLAFGARSVVCKIYGAHA